MDSLTVPIRSSKAKKAIADDPGQFSRVQKRVLDLSTGAVSVGDICLQFDNKEAASAAVDHLFSIGMLKEVPVFFSSGPAKESGAGEPSNELVKSLEADFGSEEEDSDRTPNSFAPPAKPEDDGCDISQMRAMARERSHKESLESRNAKKLKEADRKVQRESVADVWDEAESRAKREAIARASLEEELRNAQANARAEAEKRTAIERELNARISAQRDEEAKAAALEEQIERAAAAQKKAADEAQRIRAAERRDKEARLGMLRRKNFRIGAGIVAALLIGSSFFIYKEFPVNTDECSKTVSEWLGAKVEVDNCSAMMLPKPSINAFGIRAADGSMEARMATLLLSPMSVVSRTHQAIDIELFDVKASAEAFEAISKSKKLPEGTSIPEGDVNKASVYIADIPVESMSGTVAFNSGMIDAIRLFSDDKRSSLTIKTTPGVAAFSYESSSPSLIGGIFGSVSDVYISGTLKAGTVEIESYSARFPFGVVKGKGSYKTLPDGKHSLSGTFESNVVEFGTLMPWGITEGQGTFKGTFKSEGGTIVSVINGLVVEGSGVILNGAVKDLDFAKALGIGRTAASKTRFSAAEGSFVVTSDRQTISNAIMSSKPYEMKIPLVERNRAGISGTVSASVAVDSEKIDGLFNIVGNDMEMMLLKAK